MTTFFVLPSRRFTAERFSPMSFIIYLIVEGAAGFVMATFEQIFKIKEGHTLKEVRAHHGNYDDDWNHLS
jgi:hypothetical protein